MKHIFIYILLATSLFSDMKNLNSFSADFTQTITDEKNKTLTYKGTIKAKKPQYAAWHYNEPVEKKVYINSTKIVIVEPELEQVIIRKVENKFDFFSMLKDAKKIDTNLYTTHYKDTQFTIKILNSIVESITYLDEFGNKIEITFKNQFQNIEIDNQILLPVYPLNYDVIRG